jgi:prefoldin subunit 5
MENLARITMEMGGKFELHSKAISQQVAQQAAVANIGGSREMQKYISEAKKLVDASADDLDNYAKEMNPALTDFKKYIGTVFTTFDTAYEIAASELHPPDEKKQEDIEGLKTFLNTIELVQGQVSAFQQTIEGLPALTSKFKKARRNTSKVLGELVAEMRLAFIRGNQILDKIAKEKKNDMEENV